MVPSFAGSRLWRPRNCNPGLESWALRATGLGLPGRLSPRKLSEMMFNSNGQRVEMDNLRRDLARGRGLEWPWKLGSGEGDVRGLGAVVGKMRGVLGTPGFIVAPDSVLCLQPGGFESYGSSYGGAGGYTQSPGGFGSPTSTQAEKKSVSRWFVESSPKACLFSFKSRQFK